VLCHLQTWGPSGPGGGSSTGTSVRPQICCCILLPSARAVIKLCAALLMKKKSYGRKGLGLFLSSMNKVLQFLLKSDLRNLQSGYCTFLAKKRNKNPSEQCQCIKVMNKGSEKYLKFLYSVTFQKCPGCKTGRGWLFSP